MASLPDYIGTAALGLKLGVVYPGCDLTGMVTKALLRCREDHLLEDGDVACITESVVARSQDNYVSIDDVACQVREQLNLQKGGRIGVVFPILSRNRFLMILKGIAAAVPQGEVVLQLSYPTDEVGNELLPPEAVEFLDLEPGSVITEAQMGDKVFLHPITRVNYLKLYKDTIEESGAKAVLILCNDPAAIAAFKPQGVIAADIHTRLKTLQKVKALVPNAITLADLCSSGDKWSEWGLLGSNMSAGGKLKLAPREAEKFACHVQEQVKATTGKDIEIIIYGDGAYKDPTTGIYELADPMPVFGASPGICDRFREGIKYKYIADNAIADGRCPHEIEGIIESLKKESYTQGGLETEGTTPRRMGDIIASLADLISGSADAGTPVVLVKGFL
jgi:F420-0:gamma-glutamyl ligase